ncbi:hypothetical protein ACE6H2_001335 [Prunus campanulata]
MLKRYKDVNTNKKLRMSLHSMVQDYLQRNESTQLEMQRNIDLELIKKNINNDGSDFAPLPPLSIQETEVYVEVSNIPGEDSEYNAYRVIDGVSYLLSCTSPSLKVIGPFAFVCDDTPHDCSSSVEEISSCHRIVRTSFNNWKASFILLVEKYGVPRFSPGKIS